MVKHIAMFMIFVLTLVSFALGSDRGALIGAFSPEFREMNKNYPKARLYSIGVCDSRTSQCTLVTIKAEDFKNVIKNKDLSNVKYLRNYFFIVTKSYIDEEGNWHCVYVTTQKVGNRKGDFPKSSDSKPPVFFCIGDFKNKCSNRTEEPVIRTEGYFDVEVEPVIRTEGYFDVDVEPVIRTEGYDDPEVEELLYKIEQAKRELKEEEVEYLPVVPLNE